MIFILDAKAVKKDIAVNFKLLFTDFVELLKSTLQMFLDTNKT